MSEMEPVKKDQDVPDGIIGLTGLVHQGGYVYEEFLPQLQGFKARKTYKEMESNDPIIASMLFAIDMFMRKVRWSVQAASEEKKGEEDAKFLEECMNDMSGTWPDFISEVNTMLVYGWSYFEILYKRREQEEKPDGNLVSKYDDKKVGWRRFDPRSQDSLDRWEFDEGDGGIKGMWQRPAPDYQLRFIPINKGLLFRTTSRKNNPEGKSVLRSAYRPWYFKKRIEEIEGVGVERDLAGLPMAEVPAHMLSSNATDDDKAMLKSIYELVKNVRRDRQEGIIWPQQYDQDKNPMYQFKLMNSGGTRQFDTNGIITRYEQRMAMTVLADFILTGHDSTGSFALATSKSGMFQAALGAWLDIVTDVINNYAVPRLFRLNGVDGPYPKIMHEAVQQPSLADLATYVAALAGAGAQLFPDTDLENHFRKLAQLPLREDKGDDSNKEQELRNARLAAELAMTNAQKKQANNPQLMQQKPMKPLGKDPESRAGAPTKTTGRVKSKLPPQQRRDSSGARAASNTVQKADNTPEFMHAREKLGDTYPPKVLKWVDEAQWFGPLDVDLDSIKMARRPGGRDPEKVKGIAEAIDGGKKMDPVFLVMTPDYQTEEGKLRIADGYHRTLGFEKSSRDHIPAYVGVVQENEGPWDREMHDAKLNKRSGQE